MSQGNVAIHLIFLLFFNAHFIADKTPTSGPRFPSKQSLIVWYPSYSTSLDTMMMLLKFLFNLSNV